MSFSSDVKEEILSHTSLAKKKCCIIAEGFGEQLTQVDLKADLLPEYKDYFMIEKLEECCIQSILKGAFLGAGYIIDPNADYRLEILTRNKACAEYLLHLLSVLEFTPKLVKRKKTAQHVVYVSEAEQISTFLSLIEAYKAKLWLEQIRVEKEVKNNINRSVNCETANLEKTIQSSMHQIEAIKKLRKTGKFMTLSDKLKYTAALREQYPTESLDYLASQTEGIHKISKSGLKHRLDKLVALAQEIEEKGT